MIHANAQLQVEMVFAAIFYLSVLGVLLYGGHWLVGAAFNPLGSARGIDLKQNNGNPIGV